jgi:hypothetical protein
MPWRPDVRDAALRSGVFVVTASGKEIRYDDPDAQVVDMEDVFSSLEGIRRFRGLAPWSVLQHSLLVALLVEKNSPSKLAVAYGMIHDYHEAYTGDLMFSWMSIQQEVQRAKRGFDRAVYKRLGLRGPARHHTAAVAEADARALLIEACYFGLADIFKAALWQQRRKGEVGSPTSQELGLLAGVAQLSKLQVRSHHQMAISAAGGSW